MYEITVNFMGEKKEFRSKKRPEFFRGSICFEDAKSGRKFRFAHCQAMILEPQDTNPETY